MSAVRSIVLFIRAHLSDPTLRFHLYTSPPKTVLRGAKQSLVQAGLVPATVVYVGLEDPSATGLFTLGGGGCEKGEERVRRDNCTNLRKHGEMFDFKSLSQATVLD